MSQVKEQQEEAVKGAETNLIFKKWVESMIAYEQSKNSHFEILSVVVYVNGYTRPSARELETLVWRYGGQVEKMDSSRVTHMIVRPEWVLDSVRQGKLQAPASYLLTQLAPGRTVSQMFRRQDVRKAQLAPGQPISQIFRRKDVRLEGGAGTTSESGTCRARAGYKRTRISGTSGRTKQEVQRDFSHNCHSTSTSTGVDTSSVSREVEEEKQVEEENTKVRPRKSSNFVKAQPLQEDATRERKSCASRTTRSSPHRSISSQRPVPGNEEKDKIRTEAIIGADSKIVPLPSDTADGIHTAAPTASSLPSSSSSSSSFVPANSIAAADAVVADLQTYLHGLGSVWRREPIGKEFYAIWACDLQASIEGLSLAMRKFPMPLSFRVLSSRSGSLSGSTSNFRSRSSTASSTHERVYRRHIMASFIPFNRSLLVVQDTLSSGAQGGGECILYVKVKAPVDEECVVGCADKDRPQDLLTGQLTAKRKGEEKAVVGPPPSPTMLESTVTTKNKKSSSSAFRAPHITLYNVLGQFTDHIEPVSGLEAYAHFPVPILESGASCIACKIADAFGDAERKSTSSVKKKRLNQQQQQQQQQEWKRHHQQQPQQQQLPQQPRQIVLYGLGTTRLQAYLNAHRRFHDTAATAAKIGKAAPKRDRYNDQKLLLSELPHIGHILRSKLQKAGILSLSEMRIYIKKAVVALGGRKDGKENSLSSDRSAEVKLLFSLLHDYGSKGGGERGGGGEESGQQLIDPDVLAALIPTSLSASSSLPSPRRQDGEDSNNQQRQHRLLHKQLKPPPDKDMIIDTDVEAVVSASTDPHSAQEPTINRSNDDAQQQRQQQQQQQQQQHQPAQEATGSFMASSGSSNRLDLRGQRQRKPGLRRDWNALPAFHELSKDVVRELPKHIRQELAAWYKKQHSASAEPKKKENDGSASSGGGNHDTAGANSGHAVNDSNYQRAGGGGNEDVSGEGPHSGLLFHQQQKEKKKRKKRYRPPSFAEMDPEFIKELPESIRHEIEQQQQELERRRKRQRARATTTRAMTKPIGEYMKAVSTTKTTSSTMPTKSHTISSATVPVGNDGFMKKSKKKEKKRRIRSLASEISVLQLDPATMAELPESIREDLLRSLGRRRRQNKNSGGGSRREGIQKIRQKSQRNYGTTLTSSSSSSPLKVTRNSVEEEGRDSGSHLFPSSSLLLAPDSSIREMLAALFGQMGNEKDAVGGLRRALCQLLEFEGDMCTVQKVLISLRVLAQYGKVSKGAYNQVLMEVQAKVCDDFGARLAEPAPLL
eukprot:jgi/Bigna1/79894/fgenesh1_pg.66_\